MYFFSLINIKVTISSSMIMEVLLLDNNLERRILTFKICTHAHTLFVFVYPLSQHLHDCFTPTIELYILLHVLHYMYRPLYIPSLSHT